MKTRARKITVTSLLAALGGCLLASAAVAQRQEPFVPTAPAVSGEPTAPAPQPVTFAFQLARIAQVENGVKSVLILDATQPRDSKLVGQKIRFTLETSTPQNTNTRQLILNTGKHKTVAELCVELRNILRKFEGARYNALGSEMGKIGDLKHGGDIRFVAESYENVRYDMQTEGEPDRSSRLTTSEVSSFVAVLGEALLPQPR